MAGSIFPGRKGADWSRLRPVLDAAMDELAADDREAVLLRFFEGCSFAEIGTALGASEEAARKRVDRALDKLHGLLGRHKIASTSAVLATVLATETTIAAPAGLAASVTSAALATGGATAVGAAGIFALTKFQTGIVIGVVAAGSVGLLIHQRVVSAMQSAPPPSIEVSATPSTSTPTPMHQQFQFGDMIVVRSSRPPADKLKVGDKVVVRGDYVLGSRTEAVLGLSVTAIPGMSGNGAWPARAKQRLHAGSGTFELEYKVEWPGDIHISFYEYPSGGTFGEVYFGKINP